MASMQDITGLDNPNSVAQMKDWLSDQGVELESLALPISCHSLWASLHTSTATAGGRQQDY